MKDQLKTVVGTMQPYNFDWERASHVLGGENEIADYVSWFEQNIERVHLVNIALMMREVQTENHSSEIVAAFNAGIAAPVLFYQECKKELERLQSERSESSKNAIENILPQNL